MSLPETEIRKIARDEVRRFWAGLGLLMLAALSALNILVLVFIVPKFQMIFTDALPGKPLPTATDFIIHNQIGLCIVALAWPMIGFYLWRCKKQFAFIWMNVGMLWFYLELLITVIAMFQPMVGTTTGMSDAGK